MGELLLNSGHHFGLYTASSDLEAKASYMATIFRVQGPLANHRWPPASPQSPGKSLKTSMGELSLNSGHHFGLYAASSDLEAKASYMATIFRVQGPLANHR